MYDLVIPLLTFLSVMALGGAALTAWVARRQAIQTRLEQVGEQVMELSPGGFREQPRLVRALGRLGALVAPRKPSRGLRQELARAGYHSSSAAAVYLGTKVVLLALGLVVLVTVVTPLEDLSPSLKAFLILGGSMVLFFLPNLVVSFRRRKREQEVRYQLADVVDLLEICVSAGMGLDMAWNAVADEIRGVSTIVGDEMALTNLEMHLGASRSTAMRHMAERTGAEEIASLVGVLVQSDRFGTSVADALRTFATSMREMRSQRAEEAAEKMPVKLLFPLILFIFPAVLVVICGPAGIQWSRIISSG